MRIIRTETFRQDVLNPCSLKHSTNSTTGDNSGTIRGWFEHDTARFKFTYDIMGNGDRGQRYVLHIFTSLFYPFTNSFRNLVCFSQTIANLTVPIANDYNGTEAEAPATLNDFGDPVDIDYFLDELFLNPFFRSFKFSQETPPFDVFDRLSFLQ